MRSSMLALCALFLVLGSASAASVSPIEKVVEMLTDLQSKVKAEGEAEHKEFEEFSEWCEDEAKTKQFEIQTGKGQVEDLQATIAKAASDISVFETKIGELSASIASNEADLKSASAIRTKEAADFVSAEAELTEALDSVSRAIGILEKALGDKSFVQLSSSEKEHVQDVLAALSTVVAATAVNSDDRSKLAVLLQATSGEAESDEMDAPQGAPKAAAYQSKSGAIVDMLKDMEEKAEQQREELRKSEMTSKHNFAMLKQALEGEMANEKEDLTKSKKSKAATEEAKATTEAELEITAKNLAEDEKVLGELQHSCMVRATEYEASQKSRAEEMKTLAAAKKIVGDATSFSQEAVAFVQATTSTSTGLVAQRVNKRSQVLSILRRLATEHHDSRLNAMAMRLVNMVSRHSLMQLTSGDPFTKVKSMIGEMIAKLEQEAAAEAKKKAWCDKEMSETKEKRSGLEEDLDDLTAKVDKTTANIDRLGNEVKTLQEELHELAKSQQEMDKLREEQHTTFTAEEAEFSKGVNGIGQALKVLRDYYAKQDGEGEEAVLIQSQSMAEAAVQHEKAGDSAGGIISMLEVIESDFARNLAEVRTAEDTQAEEYEKLTQENKVTKMTKDQDVKYKSQEASSAEKVLAELAEDRDGKQTELDAVLEYWDKLKPQCVAKPESYAERKARREAEIDGLKNALQILEGEAIAFLQKRA